VEEAAAASQRYQETIKRLTEGRKGKEQQGGFRQQERHRELRKFVEREFEACDAISAARYWAYYSFTQLFTETIYAVRH
jgi:hypothetical protein